LHDVFVTGGLDQRHQQGRIGAQVEANHAQTEADMTLRFVGIDPDTDHDHCPTVWADEQSGELVLQGWKAGPDLRAACEANTPANGPIPDTEEVIRIPARLVPMIRKACDAVEHSVVR
jgi:hypothetical protein